eukprot:scaffold6439_cov167-Amphora_coffeaeformis.AAC.16
MSRAHNENDHDDDAVSVMSLYTTATLQTIVANSPPSDRLTRTASVLRKPRQQPDADDDGQPIKPTRRTTTTRPQPNRESERSRQAPHINDGGLAQTLNPTRRPMSPAKMDYEPAAPSRSRTTAAQSETDHSAEPSVMGSVLKDASVQHLPSMHYQQYGYPMVAPNPKQRNRTNVYASLMVKPNLSSAFRPLPQAPFYSTLTTTNRPNNAEPEDDSRATPRLSNTSRRKVLTDATTTVPSSSNLYQAEGSTKTMDSDVTPRWSNTTASKTATTVKTPSPTSVSTSWDKTAPLLHHDSANANVLPYLNDCSVVGEESPQG